MPWLARAMSELLICCWPLPIASRCSHSSPTFSRPHQAQRTIETCPAAA